MELNKQIRCREQMQFTSTSVSTSMQFNEYAETDSSENDEISDTETRVAQE